jgi:hypothetical protein
MLFNLLELLDYSISLSFLRKLYSEFSGTDESVFFVISKVNQEEILICI